MKHFKKELLLFVIALAVATAGLLQLFHEEAYAIGQCNTGPLDCNCSGNFCGGYGQYESTIPTGKCMNTGPNPSPCFGPVRITCAQYCCAAC